MKNMKSKVRLNIYHIEDPIVKLVYKQLQERDIRKEFITLEQGAHNFL